MALINTTYDDSTHRLVPVEPTPNMYCAGAEALTEHAKMLKAAGRSTDMIHTSDEALSRKIHKAMLAAAPEAHHGK